MIKKNLSLKSPTITKSHITLLEELSNANGVSGDEGEIRKIIYDRIKPIVDDITVDAIGNILVTKKGKGKNNPKVLLAAHMDEVGFMITKENGKGLYSFEIVGGIKPNQLPGKQVSIGKNNVKGVIGIKAIHQTSASERNQNISTSSLSIEVGPAGGGKVSLGDYATFSTDFSRVGPSLIGKALDDRIGVATLITLLENAPTNIDLQAAFTVQEEIGLRGAKIAGYALNPDIAIALDCTPALDHPMWDGSENTQYRSLLDLGPALYVADGGSINDPRLIRLFENVATAYNIPIQRRQPGGGRTDASAIQLERGGIPSISISVPGRYLHTAISMVRLSDWKNSLKLLYTVLSHINKNTLKGERQ